VSTIATRPPPALAALLPCRERVVDRASPRRRADIDHADADAARAGRLLVAGAEHLRRDFADQIVGPRFDVALRAALHQQHERAVAEPAEQVVRLARLGNQSGKLSDEFLDGQRTDVVRERLELVGLDRDDLADAGLDRLRQLLLQLLHRRSAVADAPVAASRSRRFRQLLVDRCRRRALCDATDRRTAGSPSKSTGDSSISQRHARCRPRAPRWRAANGSTTCPAGRRPARP
jgi:hypothetical protein